MVSQNRELIMLKLKCFCHCFCWVDRWPAWGNLGWKKVGEGTRRAYCFAGTMLAPSSVNHSLMVAVAVTFFFYCVSHYLYSTSFFYI